tara:strand:+ start:220 stop:1317 length:1098 start_codon:yes stop_codon:yes gene_type:complete
MKIYRLDQFIFSLALFLIAILFWKYDYLITSAIISLLGVGSLGVSFTDPKNDSPPKGSPEACAKTIDFSIQLLIVEFAHIKERDGELNYQNIKEYISGTRAQLDRYTESENRKSTINYTFDNDKYFWYSIHISDVLGISVTIYGNDNDEYEGFLLEFNPDKVEIVLNDISDKLFGVITPTQKTKQLNETLLKLPNYVDGALIDKPWRNESSSKLRNFVRDELIEALTGKNTDHPSDSQDDKAIPQLPEFFLEQERILICPNCNIKEKVFDLANRKDATIYIYNFLSPSVRKKDGLNIYPLICFTCNKLSKWAYDGLNESGNAKFNTEYFETRNITKADQNEALSEARIWGHFLQILKLKNLKTGL